ncbi:TPA: hypothetical protein ACT9KN_002968, partial [Legionella pneumophila]
ILLILFISFNNITKSLFMVYFVEIDGNSEKSGGSEAMKMLEEKIRHLQKMLDEKKARCLTLLVIMPDFWSINKPEENPPFFIR